MSEKSKTIEDKMTELRMVVAWFESDDFELAKAASQFEKASKLAAEIEHDLSKLKNTVEVLKTSFEET